MLLLRVESGPPHILTGWTPFDAGSTKCSKQKEWRPPRAQHNKHNWQLLTPHWSPSTQPIKEVCLLPGHVHHPDLGRVEPGVPESRGRGEVPEMANKKPTE